jgi:proton glutamate symport protein
MWLMLPPGRDRAPRALSDRWTGDADMNLSAWVIVGAASGALVGVFCGDYAAVLEPLGAVYVALLQMVVFPFILTSLLHGLGSLRSATALRLLRSGWLLFVLAWGGTLAAMWLLAQAVPAGRPPIVVTADHGQGAARLVSLLVPANPFADLSRNYVPAIVVFSVFYGIAMQRIENKGGLLSALDVVRRASVTIWNWVVRLAPLGVFALFADLAGTIRLDLLGSLLLYAVLFVGGALILALWVLPSLIASLVPIGYRALLKELQGAIVIAVVTSLPVAAVPFIVQVSERLAARCRVEDADRHEIISTTMAVSYPLAQLGNLFVFFFMVFAAFYFHRALPGVAWISLPPLTLLSTVGTPVSTVDAVAFLASWLRLPADAQLLYVEMMTLTRYPQVLVSTMGLAFITILVPLSYYGVVKVQPRKLAVSLVIAVLLLGGLTVSGRAAQAFLIEKKPNPYLHFTLGPGAAGAADVTLHRVAPAGDAHRGQRAMDRIRETGRLRVGYATSVIPFSYFNAANDLVGYDIAFAYALARDLNVALDLLPIADWETLNDDLAAGRYDLAVGGIYVTDERLRAVTVSKAYLQSPLALIVRSSNADRFLRGAEVKREKGLKIATFKSDVVIPLARTLFPHAEVVVVPDYDVLLRDESIDAALWTLEQARAWAAANPGFSAVVPTDFGPPLLMAYLMPPHSQTFAGFIDQWLDLQRASGFERRMREYWLQGRPRPDDRPRWSVIRNVLHWVE